MSDSTTGPDVIELAVPLTAEFASTVRVVVASIGADLDFTIDELDDLRLGVSEVFTLLGDTAHGAAWDTRSAARCHVTIRLPGDHLAITMSRRPDGAPVELDGLASTILTSVVDEHEVVVGGIVLRKRVSATLGGDR